MRDHGKHTLAFKYALVGCKTTSPADKFDDVEQLEWRNVVFLSASSLLFKIAYAPTGELHHHHAHFLIQKLIITESS